MRIVSRHHSKTFVADPTGRADTVTQPDGLRVAFVYEKLYPHSIGGAERYYGTLARAFANDGQRATLLTSDYGDEASRDEEGGLRILGLVPAPGERAGLPLRLVAKLRWSLLVGWHLLRHGRDYDIVHCATFPITAFLAASAALFAHPTTKLVADWHEVVSGPNWRQRFGRLAVLADVAQRFAIRRGDAAITFSQLHEGRLRDGGRLAPLEVLPEFPPEESVTAPAGTTAREKVILFVGRLVAEKRPHLVPLVLEQLDRHDPDWRATIVGSGPEREKVEELAERLGLRDRVEMTGPIGWADLSGRLAQACVLVLPTTREGFGLAVIEAAAHGLPVVLVAGPDNAAVELISAGQNGTVCVTAEPEELAAAVLALSADPAIHAKTSAWFEAARETYSVETVRSRLRALHADLWIQ